MVRVINALVIEDRKVLLCKKKEIWILPGGKKESGESDLECLAREISEELPGTELDLDSAEIYGYFNGISPHRKQPIEVSVYLTERKVKNELKTFAEITEARFFCYDEMVGNDSIMGETRKIIERLRRENYF